MASSITDCIKDSSYKLVAPSWNSSTKYLWNTGDTTKDIFAKQGGNYYVVLNSEGCVDTQHVKTDLYPSPLLELGKDTAICIGQLLKIIPNTLSNYSTIWWNGKQSNLDYHWADKPGTYTCALQKAYSISSGQLYCFVSDSIVLTAKQYKQKVNIRNDTIVCPNTVISLDAGKGFISYEWNSGETFAKIATLQSGLHKVSCLDSVFCPSEDSMELKHFVLKPLELGNDKYTCIGDSIRISAPSGYNGYKWHTGSSTQSIYGSFGNFYAIVVTDNNKCSQTDTIRVLASIPNAEFTVSQIGGNIFQFSPLVTNYPSYFWDFGDGSNSSAKSPTHTYNAANTYVAKLSIKDSLACNESSIKAVTATITGIGNLQKANTEITAFPNPTDGNVTVIWTKLFPGTDWLEVYDMTGKLFCRMKTSDSKLLIPPEHFNYQKGIFLIRISNVELSQTLKVERY